MNESMKAKDQIKFEGCKEKIRTILEAIKVESFTNPQNATDEEAMGLLVSKFFEWDGASILETAHKALLDANFCEADQVATMLEKYNQDVVEFEEEEGCELHGMESLVTEWRDGVSQGTMCKACEDEGAEFAQPFGSSPDPVRIS